MTDSRAGAFSDPTAEFPGYRLLFPPGWVAYGVGEDAERDVLVRTRAKLKPLGRPELDFSITASVKSAFRQLRSQEALALYIPSDVAEDSILPMSMTASRLTDPVNGSLDYQITVLFRDHAAEFLGEDRNIVRWRRVHRQIDGMAGLMNQQVNYAIPVPGTGRHLALLLSTSIIQDPAGSISDDTIELMVRLSDSIVGTFTWASTLGSRG